MTRFNQLAGFKEPEEWENIAYKNVATSGQQFQIIGGLILGGAIAAMSAPVAGALVAIWTLYNAKQNTDVKSIAQELIQTHHCVAHALEGNDFTIYTRQVGDNEVLEQLKFALKSGADLTDSAYDFYESNQSSIERETEQFRPLTALANAVNKYLPARQDADFIPVETQFIDTSEQPITDLVSGIAENLGRVIIYGAPSAGKDFFMSHLYRAIKKQHGDKAKIFMLDCKDHELETGYFIGAVDKLWRLSVFESPASEVYRWLSAALDEFEKYDAGMGIKVLCVNEVGTLNEKLDILGKDKSITSELGTTAIKWWTSKFNGYAKSGDSKGYRLIFASQNGHATNIKMDGGNKSSFQPYLIARDCNMAETELILAAQIIANERKISSTEMESLCKKSPVGRCIFHGGLNRWLPMPELENFSGFNRDQRTLIQDSKTTIHDATTKLQTDAVTDMLDFLRKSQALTLRDFIIKDLDQKDGVDDIFNALVGAMRTRDDKELLARFNIPAVTSSDPLFDIKVWRLSLTEVPTIEQVKDYWFLLTGQRLKDNGAQMLLEQLN